MAMSTTYFDVGGMPSSPEATSKQLALLTPASIIERWLARPELKYFRLESDGETYFAKWGVWLDKNGNPCDPDETREVRARGFGGVGDVVHLIAQGETLNSLFNAIIQREGNQFRGREN